MVSSFFETIESSNWRLSSEQVGGTECSFVCHVPSPRGISPGYWPFWPSGANLLAQKQHMYFFGASVTTVRLFFFVIGRVLTRLD